MYIYIHFLINGKFKSLFLNNPLSTSTLTRIRKLCENHGIRRNLTTAYMPQQNEVCERKNHTIPNMVRSLLVGSNIPKSFCLEVVKWTIHILIRNPTLIHNMMSEEA